ncbi:LysR family transcriptional regulator [Streptomyces sp. DSM 41527]|uniref:LysR family transcriptional regulator n=1 Tax=Streptomyces mooreae TaxID=3075523 RepID=A0ABU2TEF2_9ACTN|nr:LysR family transcriptional regulator [Streptomyces sp. DSM 41527]MDT0459322.1 LysR family transcriptional regulator [Streptomyces sp. DSM 41527]
MLHLRYFVAVAEELNFSQAARKLHMAASPLSRRIKDLERELHQTLFDRTTHHVALTPAGAALLPMARDVLDRVNSIPWRLREAVRPQRTTLLIGMPSGVHPRLRARVRELEEACGETYELKRWPGRSTGLAEAVRDGRLALALARLPVADPALGMIEVMRERLGAAVPADRFEGRESVTLDELKPFPFVATAPEALPAYFDEIDARLNSAGLKKRIRINSSDYAGTSELVSGGLAFSMTMLSPESPMQLYRLDNVKVLPVADFQPELATGLLFRTDRAEPGGDLEELVTAARRIFAEELFA